MRSAFPLFQLVDTRSEDLTMAFLSLAEIRTNLMFSSRDHCKLWSHKDYLQYIKEAFVQSTMSSINCSIYYFGDYLMPAYAALPKCESKQSAEKTYEMALQYFSYMNSDEIPCSQVSYKYELEYQGKSSFYDPKKPFNHNSEYFVFFTFFNKLETEERTETLIYDAVNFLSAAGGNLGLFVGFSCLSVIFAIIDLICKHLSRYYGVYS